MGYFPIFFDVKRVGARVYVSVIYTNFFSDVIPVKFYSFIDILISSFSPKNMNPEYFPILLNG